MASAVELIVNFVGRILWILTLVLAAVGALKMNQYLLLAIADQVSSG